MTHVLRCDGRTPLTGGQGAIHMCRRMIGSLWVSVDSG